MNNTQSNALRLADALDGNAKTNWTREEAAAELRRQHARIAELEAQLSSSGFTAADMATAAAQGFRDGVASLSASAPAPSEHIKEPYTLAEVKAKIASNDYSAEMLLQHAMLLLDSASPSANAGEPVAFLVCTEEGDPAMVFLDRLEACQYCEDDDPPKPLYLAAPPTAQAEGWTKQHRTVTYVCPVCAASLERQE